MKIDLDRVEWEFVRYMSIYTKNSLLLSDCDIQIVNSILEKLGREWKDEN